LQTRCNSYPITTRWILCRRFMILNLVFVLPLMWYWNVGHLGLALATSVAAYINAGLLLSRLSRDRVFVFQPGWGVWLGRLLSASLVMALLLVLLAPDTSAWLEWDWRQRVWRISLICALGIATYMGIHLLLGTRWRSLHAPVSR